MFGDSVPVAFVMVSDRAAGRAFYEGVLGLAHEAADEFGDFFRFGAGRLRLTAMPGFTGGEHPVLGWQVADIAAAAAALKARGVALTLYPGMGQDADGIWTAPGGSARVAWFKDPDGNVLSLNQIG